MKHPEGKGWIGVDFDRTLAHYIDWETNGTNLGHPVPLMLERVKRWLAMGQEVKVFTARASSTSDNREQDIALIKEWCLKYLGQELDVTAEKDFNMLELWDDRAVNVKPNEGYTTSVATMDPLTNSEELKLWRRRTRKEDDDE